MRTIIIDDEPYSRDELQHLLKAYGDIVVIGEANSGEKGLELIMKETPDVVFLDIEMAGMNGMELAEVLQNLKKTPYIVFATAYPDYAPKAFRIEAVDYLLKPFDETQIEETVKRLRERFRSEVVAQKQQSRLARLAVQDEDRIIYLNPLDILYVSREERETNITTAKSSYTCKYPIKELEEKLVGYPFYRVHKSFLINLNTVEQLIPWGNGVYQVKLENVKQAIPVSRNYVKELRERLEL
ncbi:two-component system response regulator LytT [Bacillus pakistanensis]|uniref:Two-component system response regulator LytT n=1 Tax=Rossellomorea pakistanensis TaxID=992288 RepID=A0ABS2NJL9_9BACI|nr:LytTR family DNA-binding domain-containing protein [Bacillus pakistanensis]MBM7588008.1 two-component system response regulator LytT [Bacillus pakistanensis]